MNIRTKNTLVLTCVFVALLIVSLGVRHFVLAPSFQSLEYEEALKNGNRCVQAVEREIDHLNSVCLEWSDWDDLHQYVVDRNEGFHQANLATTEYFQRANLPVMVILDVNNRVVWMTCLDLETLEQVELPEFPRDEFPADHPLIRTNHPKGYINGILLTERGPMLVASRPIITLAHNLGSVVIAEGVETPEHLAQLQALECDLAQGYLFSRPVPASEIEAMLRAKPEFRAVAA